MSAHAAPMAAGGATTARTRPTWTWLAATGLGLVALAPTIMFLSSMAAGLDLGEDTGFFLAMILVPAITAGLVLRFGTWAKVVGVLISLAAGLSMFWMAFGLGYPAAFADFTPGVALPLGVLAGIGGSVAAIVAGRRGRTSDRPVGLERRLVVAMVGLVAAAAVLSLALDLLTGGTVAASEGAVSATMRDFSFEEGTYTVTAGPDAEVVVHNSDPFLHDFAVPALGIDPVKVGPGAEALVVIGDAEPGTYTIYCTLHSDTDAPDGGEGGMAATLVVE